jgi:hypothetical protein
VMNMSNSKRPGEFATQIKREFGFDVRKDESWKTTRAFHCPANLLDEIYDNSRWGMGS